MVTPLDVDFEEIPKPECHILSFSSLGMPWERVIFIIALAQSFSRQGYRVLLVDLDFEVPLFATSLVEYGKDIKNAILSNDLYTGETVLSTEEVLQRATTVTPHPLFPISVIPSSTDVGKLRRTQSMDRKEIRQAFSRISRFFRELKEEEFFDVILVNVPYMNPHAINGMMVADYNFVLIDHDQFSFHLMDQYIDTMVGVYPELNIAGIILHRFQYAPAPENDAVTVALLEEQLRYPIIAKLPSLRDNLFPKLDKKLWKFQNQQLQEFFESIVFNLIGFLQTPRRLEKKTKLVYYQLTIIKSGGLQLYRHTFKTSTKVLEEEEGILASAGLSSIITGTEIMISEIIRQRESAKLIEMKNVKLIIEQWKDVKAILIANLYDEQTRRRLKALVLHFVQKYEKELKNFRGDIKAFKGAKSLVEEHLLQKSTGIRDETIMLPLNLIRGIGITRTWELQKLGITSVNDLVKSNGKEIATKIGVGVSLVNNWINQGQRLISEETQLKG